jgi:murein DD-endopeptidase MepM/ murein hydrolase activator NlpD
MTMRVLTAAILASSFLASATSAQSLKSGQILSSLSVRPLSQANPVLGTDNRVHLAYELVVSNPGQFFITIDKVEALDGSGSSLFSLAGKELSRMTTHYAGTGDVLAPGESSIVFMDVSFTPEQRLPGAVEARVSLSRQGAVDGKAVPLQPGSPMGATATFSGASTKVAPGAARVIEPPLKGAGWVAVNGCCDAITSHRGAVIAVNGQLNVPERFAIDWIKMNDKNEMYTGDKSKLASYAFYGDPVYSVADGVVVNTYDDADEQVPMGAITGITPENIGGNMMVVDIGGGAYAFYAHFQRGSLKAKLGDHVKTGQVLGLLGNTGNSSAPHLHFHLMDGPIPLYANGVPYVFTHFSSSGVVPADQEDPFFDGKPVTLDKRLSGQHERQLPLNNEVVSF